jgi:hypothetical protein
MKENFENNNDFNIPGEEIIKGISFNNKKAKPKPKVNKFTSNLKMILKPNISVRETIEDVVKSALEVEFGASFLKEKSFAQMQKVITDAIVSSRDLKEQTLAVASDVLRERLGIKGKSNG